MISPIFLSKFATINLNLKNYMTIYKNVLFCLLLIFTASKILKSDDRKFTYVYQSNVMAKGEKHIEVWSTARLGKDIGYYARMENRLEYEVGLSKKLTTAVYLNFRNTTTDNGTGVNETEFEFKGISSEWKYQVSSPISNALGFGLYGELGLNTDEVELETKLLFDKKIKKTTVALNFIYEHEWELTPGKPETEKKLIGTFGLSYNICPSFHAGFELLQSNVFTDEGYEHSAFFGGPVISYAPGEWFATLTILPQIAGFKGKTVGSNLNLSEYEKLNARLIFAFHL